MPGRRRVVGRLLEEWAEFDRELLSFPMYERCQALLAAGRGFPAETERWASETIARAEAAGDPTRAAESLRAVREHTEREGVDEPGVFPVAPDLVEALLEIGQHGEALAVTRRLAKQAEEQEHPWGLLTARRCGALIRLASSAYDEEAGKDLATAAAGYSGLGLRFDHARSLLSLGRAQRRLKKWGAARQSLEQAVAAFDEIGSDGWAEQARAELARVGARRRRADGGLTPTEQRVAALAADGLPNKQIAATLFVTVHTIEVHLSHAYAKLGVRSRAQLARRLSATAQPKV